MVDYVATDGCRRSRILSYFGHPLENCRPDQQPCDRCSGAVAPWAELPDSRVPDPETLVDVEVVVLQAIAWACSYAKGRYGERGLRAAVAVKPRGVVFGGCGVILGSVRR
jgi:ATP-dependent DNA helicase RecQ